MDNIETRITANNAKFVEDNKNLNILLFSPTVWKTNQGKILNDILKKGKADKLTINFCGILCRNGRVNLITKIMREFFVQLGLPDTMPKQYEQMVFVLLIILL